MMGKQKREKTPPRVGVKTHKQVARAKGASAHTPLASVLLRPSVKAAFTLEAYPVAGVIAEFEDYVDELAHQAGLIESGNMRRVEAILLAQAHSLDAIFNHLARRAATAQHIAQFESVLKFGLRAQSQCRATLETLALIKHPQPIAIVRQANISSGPQQVNNGAGSPPRKIETVQNELLEVRDEKRLDGRTARTPKTANSKLEALEEVDRASHRPRKGRVLAER